MQNKGLQAPLKILWHPALKEIHLWEEPSQLKIIHNEQIQIFHSPPPPQSSIYVIKFKNRELMENRWSQGFMWKFINSLHAIYDHNKH